MGILRAYKIENGTLPVAGRIAAAGSYRVNQSQDAVWPPAGRAYGGEVESRWKQVLDLGLVALKLLVPVLLLLTLLLAVYLYADAMLPVTALPGVTLTVADLVLPGCWTIIHLTNRRYGPPYAFAQLAAGFVLAALVALINPGDIDHWLPPLPWLTTRAVLAFFAAFAIANFVAIMVFDAARGPRWWGAPLAASAAAALVYAGVYYPLAFGAEPVNAVAHFLLWLMEGVALLGPYCLLRPAMRPLNGMNGF